MNCTFHVVSSPFIGKIIPIDVYDNSYRISSTSIEDIINIYRELFREKLFHLFREHFQPSVETLPSFFGNTSSFLKACSPDCSYSDYFVIQSEWYDQIPLLKYTEEVCVLIVFTRLTPYNPYEQDVWVWMMRVTQSFTPEKFPIDI